jgi:nitrite reductase (NO-forming)
VRPAQRAARDGLVLSGCFVAAAVVAAGVPGPTGRWLPLHLLLAGGLGCAISGVAVLLAVTWSTAPPPDRRTTHVQLALVASGAAGVAATRAGWPGSTWVLAPAVAYAVGLLVLAVVLVGAVARGGQRRFDVAAAWYVAALACGVVAVGFGAALATGRGPAGGRDDHVALNLLGLVGLMVGGTAPNLAATIARTRTSTHATAGRRAALLGWQLVSLAAVVAGAEAIGLAAYGAGIAALVLLLPRPDGRQLAWAGPRLVAFHAALLWWLAAVVGASARAAAGMEPLGGRPLLVLVLAAYAQLLWASAAYLVPVVRAGGHERLAAGFARTGSWTTVVVANVAGVLLVAGATSFAVLLLGVAALDVLRRGAIVLRGAA